VPLQINKLPKRRVNKYMVQSKLPKLLHSVCEDITRCPAGARGGPVEIRKLGVFFSSSSFSLF
jgi:hypothetical protein